MQLLFPQLVWHGIRSWRELLPQHPYRLILRALQQHDPAADKPDFTSNSLEPTQDSVGEALQQEPSGLQIVDSALLYVATCCVPRAEPTKAGHLAQDARDLEEYMQALPKYLPTHERAYKRDAFLREAARERAA